MLLYRTLLPSLLSGFDTLCQGIMLVIYVFNYNNKFDFFVFIYRWEC